MQRTAPWFVPLLVVNEQKGCKGHNDAPQAEGEHVTDVMTRYTGAGLVGGQLSFGFFGFEMGHGLLSSNLEEIKRRNRGLVALNLSEDAFGGRGGIASVWRTFWLDQQEVNLLAGNGAMFHSFGDDVHLTGI